MDTDTSFLKLQINKLVSCSKENFQNCNLEYILKRDNFLNLQCLLKL